MKAMIDSSYIILSTIPVILSALGTGIGQGLIGKQALQSMIKQPSASNALSKLCIIGTAITETAAIMGVLISLLLINDANSIENIWSHYALIGIAFAMGISGFFAGIASSFPVIASCQSLARQPFLQGKILNIMLITQTLIMTGMHRTFNRTQPVCFCRMLCNWNQHKSVHKNFNIYFYLRSNY